MIPADSDTAGGNSVAVLIDAIRAEMAALEAEDAERIEAATADKLAALERVRVDIAGGMQAPRELLVQARDLNAEAALRARAKILGVERRLAAVSAVAGRPAALTYGRNGRWS